MDTANITIINKSQSKLYFEFQSSACNGCDPISKLILPRNQTTVFMNTNYPFYYQLRDLTNEIVCNKTRESLESRSSYRVEINTSSNVMTAENFTVRGSGYSCNFTTIHRNPYFITPLLAAVFILGFALVFYQFLKFVYRMRYFDRILPSNLRAVSLEYSLNREVSSALSSSRKRSSSGPTRRCQSVPPGGIASASNIAAATTMFSGVPTAAATFASSSAAHQLNPHQEHTQKQTSVKTANRVHSIDAFRGFSLVLMIFVNYGGGGYYFFQHSAWNGLTCADLVFPWFMFIMGVTLVISLSRQYEKTRRETVGGGAALTIAFSIIRRALILFTLGLIGNSAGKDQSLSNLRIPGVLQRFAVTYLCAALFELSLLVVRQFCKRRRIRVHTASFRAAASETQISGNQVSAATPNEATMTTGGTAARNRRNEQATTANVTTRNVSRITVDADFMSNLGLVGHLQQDVNSQQNEEAEEEEEEQVPDDDGHLLTSNSEAKDTQREMENDLGRPTKPVQLSTSVFRPNSPSNWLPHVTLIGLLIMTHTLITFEVTLERGYEHCRGYLGPGGPYIKPPFSNCTGGVAAQIDRVVFGRAHIYQTPTCRQIYACTEPHDPEGLLGCLTSLALVLFGVLAGKILQKHEKRDWKQITIKMAVLAFLTMIAAGTLCIYQQNDGWIPINKNLWSVSFILVMAGFSYVLLFVFYYLIDVKRFWRGWPFTYAGRNAITLYMLHELLNKAFPVHWQVAKTHTAQIAVDLWGTIFWIWFAYYLDSKKIYITV